MGWHPVGSWPQCGKYVRKHWVCEVLAQVGMLRGRVCKTVGSPILNRSPRRVIPDSGESGVSD
jgi:hypothetical protein